MPDRTIPYFNLILRCDRFEQPIIPIPDGYRIIRFHQGLQSAWAKLETNIGDFGSEAEAGSYFAEKYLPYPDRLEQRALFLSDHTDRVIGSCIAWQDPREGRMVSSLHWLVINEAHQGKGLGRALFSETMRLFDSFPVYIHTQPWSWKAVLLYLSSGFKLQMKDTFNGYENQYKAGIEALKAVLTEDQMRFIAENTES